MADESAHAQNGPEEKTDEPFTHYVHLADGRVIKYNAEDKKAKPLGSHYVEGEDHSADDGEDERIQTPIIGVYPR